MASGSLPVLGGHIALGGIAVQLLVLILYTFLAVDFLIRFTLDKPMRRNREEGIVLPRGKMDGPIASMLIGLLAMLVFLLIRSTYRVIELAGGWEGKVISTQWLFNVFDGTMVALAIFTLNLFHPGMLLRGPDILNTDIDEVEEDQQSQCSVHLLKRELCEKISLWDTSKRERMQEEVEFVVLHDGTERTGINT